MDYVVALENSKPLRKWGMVSHLEFSQRSNANKVVSWFKTWLEIDYASQINVLEQLNSSREAEDAVRFLYGIDMFIHIFVYYYIKIRLPIGN